MPTRVILGPFHPHLEDALVQEILAEKALAPLVPLLILVPSDALRGRLKTLLAHERRLSLVNVYILTFHQLSLRLLDELRGAEAVPLEDDAFFEEALKQIIRAGERGTEAFAAVVEQAQGGAALWQTLRDLKDGGVEPQRVLDALDEGYFGEEGKEKVSSLFRLFAAFLDSSRQWSVRDYSDLDSAMLPRVPGSSFLKQFRRIFYYGFYDLTQVQIDLFHSIARDNETTLLFPLVRGGRPSPAWDFARRFFERHAEGLAGGGSEIRNLVGDPDIPGRDHSVALPLFHEGPEPERAALAENFRCTIFSCSGPRDEVAAAAKEILKLVSDEQLPFAEIGVVARSLEPYVPWIREIFGAHEIPVAALGEEPLTRYPLAKAVLLLLNLLPKSFLRPHVIDLVSSPFFSHHLFCPEGTTPRPDLWDLATRRLGITKGNEWARLEKQRDRELSWAARPREDEEPQAFSVSAAQLGILRDIFAALDRDLASLPAEASWSQYVNHWKSLLQKYLGVAESTQPAEDPHARVQAAILRALQRLTRLDAVNPGATLLGFIRTFEQGIERSSVPLADTNSGGVAIMDAMAARGIPFRALFVLGLNEGIFPRAIHEDAFLRDRDRRVLETVLGYKVSEKLAGFDEEKLLFALLVGAARERLYCLYQRTDASGRLLAPSWYIGELRRALPQAGAGAPTQITVPRGIFEKRGIEPFHRIDLLPPEELAVRLSLEARDPGPLIGFIPYPEEIYRGGRRALELLDDSRSRLGSRDGLVGALAEYRDHLDAQGISPTALERYASCPFRFFALDVLRLQPLEYPEETSGLSPADAGRLAHLILKLLYQEVSEEGCPAASMPAAARRARLEAAARKAFAEYESAKPIGYPAVWEVFKEALLELLDQAVAMDLAELNRSGYRPIAFEIEAQERIEDRLRLRGRLDRIDHQPGTGRYRVIDYKLKFHRTQLAEDKNLLLSALRGRRLQPPLYLLLGKRFAEDQGENRPLVEAAFYFLAPRWSDGPLVTADFPPDAWEGPHGEDLKETVSLLLDGIRQGRFFIVPGPYCDYCEVAEICRKTHLPSCWRAENDPAAKALLGLRHKNLIREPVSHAGDAPPRSLP